MSPAPQIHLQAQAGKHYVDDILMCSTTEDLADEITAQLEAKFDCVNLGEISWCLGMRIQTSKCRHVISLDLD